jgi:hypothetical protein
VATEQGQRAWTSAAGARAASELRDLSGQVQALAEGRPEEAGVAGDYVRSAGQKLQQLADRIESGGVDGAVSDLQGFARRRPGALVLTALAAGIAVGYLVRGGRDQPGARPALPPTRDEAPVPELPAAATA